MGDTVEHREENRADVTTSHQISTITTSAATSDTGIQTLVRSSDSPATVARKMYRTEDKYKSRDSQPICHKFLSCYAYFVAHFPWLMIVLVLLTVGISLGLSIQLVGFPKFGQLKEGFTSRGTYLKGAQLSYKHLTRSLKRLSQTAFQTESDTIDDDYMKFVFTGKFSHQNLFTVEAVHEICQFEQKIILTSPHYKDGTKAGMCRGLSLGYLVGLLARNKDCMELTEGDLTTVLGLIQYCMPMIKSADDHTNDTNCNETVSNHNVIYLLTRYLVDSSFSRDLEVKYTMLMYPNIRFNIFQFYMDHIDGKSFRGNHTNLVAFGLDILNELNNTYIKNDSMLLVISAVLIMIMTLMYTRSFVITVAMICSIAFSIVMSYFIYRVVLQIEFFSFLNLLSALVLIALGADDVFVFMDIWSQEKQKYMAAHSVNKLDKKELPTILTNTLQHAALSILLTSLSTASAFLVNIWSAVTVIKCFGIFSALCVFSCFCFMLTLIPAIVILLEEEEQAYLCQRRCCSSLSWKLTAKVEGYVRKATFSIFARFLPYLVDKTWWLCSIVLILLGGGALFVIFDSPGLHTPTSEHLQFFKSSNLVQEYDFYIAEKFPFSTAHVDELVKFVYVFGVVGIDNGHYYSDKRIGHLELDTDFKFSDPDVIKFLTDFCEDLLHAPFISNDTKANGICLLSVIKALVKDACDQSNPLQFPCCGQTWPLSADIFQYCLAQVAQNWSSTTNILGVPYVDLDLTVKAFSINVESCHFYSASYDPMDKLYRMTRHFLDRRLSQNPQILQTAYINYYQYMNFYDLQKGLFQGTIANFSISLVCALTIMLLSSCSVLISVYAILSITLAVSVTVGILVLSGWELNIFESVTLTIAIGLSIDFTIHYGTAYIVSEETSRSERVKSSFKTVGPAVFMAALTTFVAGVPVLAAELISVYKMGTFLMLVMFCSWGYATFLFQSLCHGFGPTTKRLKATGECFLISVLKKCKISPTNILVITSPIPDSKYISSELRTQL